MIAVLPARRDDPRALKRVALETALAAGAGAVRIAAAYPDAQARRAMADAFARGDHATWGFDDAYACRASDPTHLIANARSIVCVALPYATRAPARTSWGGTVSNYAWSEDYHRRLRPLLERVADALDTAAGAHVTAVACDTQPLAERAFAARAGLAWIGKHTNAIVPRLGSFVFLGEVVTTLALPPDPPVATSCGTCTRCVDVCPTGALRGDYTIDATRCISDLTQRTDEIPLALRPLIGTWVWGCDLCQQVCPPTQRAGAGGDATSAPLDAGVAAPDLIAMLRMRHGTFKRRFKRTAMGWRGAAVLRRNAAVALGNALDRAAVPALSERLGDDPHPMVRGHVAWALGRIASPPARAALRAALDCESAASVRAEIARALRACDAPPSPADESPVRA